MQNRPEREELLSDLYEQHQLAIADGFDNAAWLLSRLIQAVEVRRV